MTRLAESASRTPIPGHTDPIDFPIRQRIMDALANRIVSGRYAPGKKLPVEAVLIDELHVSRTALREAMRTLAAKGMVVSRKKAGTVVRPLREWNLLDADVLHWIGNADLGDDYLREICEARLIFEPKAARLAATRASRAEVEHIALAYTAMTEAANAGSDNLSGWIEADVAFHEAILRGASNLVLIQLTSVMGAALRSALRSSAKARSDFTEALRSHRAVLEAIQKREPDRAEAVMLSLIASAVQNLSITELLPGSGEAR